MELTNNFRLNKLKRSLGFISRIKQPSVLIITILSTLMMLIWLSSATGGRLDTGETNFLSNSSSLTGILSDPLNLFHKVLVFILTQAFGDGAFWVRLPSVLMAGATVWLFGSILSNWFNKFSVFFSTILFASSLWILHFGRLGLPDVGIVVALLAILFALVRVSRLKQSVNRFSLTFGLALLFGFSFYIPGCWLLWLVLLLWQRRKLIVLIRRLPLSARLLGAATTLLLLVPFFVALVNQTDFGRDWIGIAPGFSINSVGEQVWQWLSSLFVFGPRLPNSQWLSGQTVFPAFEIVLIVVGGISFVKNWRLKRARAVGLLLVICIVLAIISQQGLFGFTIVPGFILMSAGLSLLLSRWHAVFPRNPLAFGVGVFLIGLACAATVMFTTKSYFVAWRSSPITTEAYHLKS